MVAAQRFFDAILFDLDGTLVDSERISLDVMHELAAQEGVPLDRATVHARLRGVRMADCVAWIASYRAGKPAGFEEDFTRRVRALSALRFREGLAPMAGAHALLSALPMPFAVATNGPREKAELTLGLTGLLPLLQGRVFCAYEVGSFKPEPGLFLHAAQALGAAPARCAVVEDSVPGMEAGLAAGMRVFALHAAHGLPPHLAGQVTPVDGLADLHPHLGLA